MKKQIAKTITTLSLMLVLSAGAINVSAFPGCDTPSCRCSGSACRTMLAAPALAQNLTQVPAQDRSSQESLPTAQSESTFNFAFFLVQLAMSFLYLP